MNIAEKSLRLKQDFDDVYAAGYEKGKSEGGDATEAYNEGFEAGTDKAYDELWESIQLGGTRAVYSGFFKGEYWNENTFKPKYDLKPTGNASSMFDRFGGMANTTQKGINLAQLLENREVVLDTSRCTNLNNLFYYSSVSRVPTISAVGCTSQIVGALAQCAHLKTIDKLVLKDDGSNTFNNVFQLDYELENIVIEGTIGQNGFDLHWSTKLSKSSIASIINALSENTSGLTVTLSETAVNNAFSEDEWNTLVATKQNWTISLV